MAEASASTILTDLFECQTCFDLLENAQFLPCGHALCGLPKNCLSHVLNNTNLCPVCGDEVSKEYHTVLPDVFPTNAAMQSETETFRVVQQFTGRQVPPSSPTSKNDICAAHLCERKFYCRPCGKSCCELCWDEDHGTEDHSLIRLEKFKKEKMDIQFCQPRLKLNERNIGEVVKMYGEVTSKCSRGGELLNQIERLLNEKTALDNDLRTSKSGEEMLESATSLNGTDGKLNQLIELFEQKCTTAVALLQRILVQLNVNSADHAINQPLLNECGEVTNRDEQRSDSKQKSITNQSKQHKFGLKVLLSYHLLSLDSRWEGFDSIRSCAVDSDNNVFLLLQDSNRSDDLLLKTYIRKMKVVRDPSVEPPSPSYKQKYFSYEDIAMSSDVLYAVAFDPITQMNRVCTISKESLLMKRIVDTSKVVNKKGTWRIKGNGDKLVLWSQEESQLYVYKNGKFLTVVPLSTGPVKYSTITANNHYLVLAHKPKLENEWQCVVIEWGNLKSLPMLSKLSKKQHIKASYNSVVLHNRLLSLLSLGPNSHAIEMPSDCSYFEKENRIKFHIYSNVITKSDNADANLTLLDKVTTYTFDKDQSMPLSELQGMTYAEIVDTVFDNVVLCRIRVESCAETEDALKTVYLFIEINEDSNSSSDQC